MADVFRIVAQERGVEELVLVGNGLRVLLVPDGSVPVVAACVVYHVGSRNEATGRTGATHLLEHLLFKGSDKFNVENGHSMARVLERVGASFNATTWFDRTTYYETLPPEHLGLALEIEADRMRHALLREADLVSEMTVVRNELERGENEPFEALLKESFAIAFREHPYHHPTIGWRSDIENASIAKLREFYDTFYYPDNASLVLVGSFERSEALALVAEHLGPLPRAPRPLPPMQAREPRQEGERRFTVSRTGEVGWVALSWRVPEAAHADTHALAVLSDALAGGVTSRLYQSLVETSLCLDVMAVPWQLRDPGLLQIFATLHPGTRHRKVEKLICRELSLLMRNGIADEELERAKVQVEAHVAFHRDSPGQVAAAFAEAVSAVDWRFYLDYQERIRAVSGADVLRAARTTFRDDAVTVGYFVPKRARGRSRGACARGVAPVPRPCHFRPALASQVREAALPSGGRLLMLPRHVNQTVHVRGSLFAGHGLVEPARWSAVSFLPDMLERGTSSYDRLTLARMLEDRAIEIDISGESANPFEVACSGRALARHLPLLLSLLVEMLLRPTFPAEEVEKLRTLRLGELAHAHEDTFRRAYEAFARLLFPPGHPNYRRPYAERRAGLEALRREELVAAHSQLYGASSLIVALVGDFDPGEIEVRMSRLLAAAPAGVAKLPEIERREPTHVVAREERVAMADKPNLDVLLGHPAGLRRPDADYLAAQLGNAILGHSTLSSRLGRRLRDAEGLTYGVISRFFGASLLDGPWAVSLSVGAGDLARATAAVREEAAKFVADGPTADELADEREAMAGAYRVALATPSGTAYELLRLARHNLATEEIDRMPGRIRALACEDVVEAIRRHIVPERFCLAVAGDLVAKAGDAD